MKNQVQNILNKFGYKLGRYPNEGQRRRLKLFEKYSIDTVIDVGANLGQYVSEIRQFGYKGKVVSFEPLRDIFIELQKISEKDPLWQTINLALGDRDENSVINISNNLASSSFLEIKGDKINSSTDEIFYIGKQTIEVKKLDSIFRDIFNPNLENIFLKIDAQGYESKILDGAENSLQFINGLQLEMSLVELYSGETLFLPLLNKLSDLGFDLKGIELGFHDPDTMELFQLDGIFYRR